MDNASKLGIGVVGAGYWAKNMLRVIADSPRSRLVGICEIDPARLAESLARYEHAQGFTDIDDLLADPSVDAVYIATPPAAHFEQAKKALEAGKHVLVEKPLATESSAARQLVELAEAAKVTLMVGHTFLYSPPVRKVKQLIDEGAMGQVFYVESQRVNLGKYQDSGVVWDLAPHDLSILLYWLGALPESVVASGRTFVSTGREDVAFLTMHFPDGALAQVHLSWLAPTKLRRMTISGSRQMVIYDDTQGPEAIKIFDRGVDRQRPPETFGEFQLSYRSGDILIPQLENREPLRNEWEHFEHCIRTGERPTSDGLQGLGVVRVLEAIDESLRTGQRVSIEAGAPLSTVS